MAIKISASYDSFRELRESGSYYIDKTDFIEEYLLNKFDKAIMFTRPRRFGKTLTMTMLKDFLDVRQDSRAIFEGLKIMDCHEAVDGYMNKYPVIFLSLKEVYGNDFEQAYENLQLIIANCCKKVDEIVKKDDILEADIELFRELEFQKASRSNTIAALDILSRLLHDHYRKPVFVIIDEYDVPMAKSLGTPHYDKVRDMIEHMLSFVCKTNENVKGVVLSGCLYTVKNSTYTGVNNIIPYSILTPNFASAIGFTDDEVKSLLEDAGIPDRYDVVEEWYDGYIFGRAKMFCPWDVLLYVRSVLDGSYSEAMGPENYWVNTSETTQSIIHGFLGKTGNANEGFIIKLIAFVFQKDVRCEMLDVKREMSLSRSFRYLSPKMRIRNEITSKKRSIALTTMLLTSFLASSMVTPVCVCAGFVGSVAGSVGFSSGPVGSLSAKWIVAFVSASLCSKIRILFQSRSDPA